MARRTREQFFAGLNGLASYFSGGVRHRLSKPTRQCINPGCGKLHSNNKPFCSAECCKAYKSLPVQERLAPPKPPVMADTDDDSVVTLTVDAPPVQAITLESVRCNPEYNQRLVSAAAEAQELYGDDELERHAKAVNLP